MNGMTGYSFNELYFEDGYLSTEVKTVNHKYLEIYIGLPFFLNSMDSKIRELVQQNIRRGKVEVSIVMKLNDNSSDINIDLSLTDKYISALRSLVTRYNLNDEIKLSHLTKFSDIIVKIDKKRDYDRYFDKLKESLLINLDVINDMRRIEGESTKKNLIDISNLIVNDVKSIKSFGTVMEKEIYDTIKKKIVELIGDKVDEIRLMNEVAIMVNRSDINEEIERLGMHTSNFINLCDEKFDIGKRLDFICQEMNREINTIGSKANLKEITNLVISIKNSIEKLREQVRNIE